MHLAGASPIGRREWSIDFWLFVMRREKRERSRDRRNKRERLGKRERETERERERERERGVGVGGELTGGRESSSREGNRGRRQGKRDSV